MEDIAPNGAMSIKPNNGRGMTLDPAQYPHLDHAYAVTSYSSQGQTADRVLIHVERTWGQGPAQSPNGLCICFTRTVGRTGFHE